MNDDSSVGDLRDTLLAKRDRLQAEVASGQTLLSSLQAQLVAHRANVVELAETQALLDSIDKNSDSV